jgi:hypothetical protein
MITAAPSLTMKTAASKHFSFLTRDGPNGGNHTTHTIKITMWFFLLPLLKTLKRLLHFF